MWINLKGKKLTATFRYDPKIVTAVKGIDGRRFNPQYKRWEFPVSSVEDVISTLKPLGFNFHEDVLMEFEKTKEREKEIDIIRSNPGLYEGKLPVYDFQKLGAMFMRSMNGSLLGDVPGLGKTIQTIAALEDEPSGPHLIFCPASLKYSWAGEIKKWQPNVNALVIDGDKEQRLKLWSNLTVRGNPQRYVIANYELLLRDFKEIAAVPWNTIVCDEATRISNPRAKTTKALKALQCKRKIALTGTPVSNSPVDIWSIVDWIQPGYLGNYTAFFNKYCIIDDFFDPTWRKISGYKNLDVLSEKVGRVMLRRTKEEVLTDFPPKTVETIPVQLSDAEKDIYSVIKNQIFEDLQKLEIEGHNLHVIPVKMLRLKQVTNDCRLVVSPEDAPPSSKLQALKDKLQDIVASGEKAIVFTQFAEMAKLLRAELEEYNPLLIYGDVSEKDRYLRVIDFNKNDTNHVLIMTEAGAYGLNLQRATYVFHYDAPWSIAKLMQREDRSHRIGQTKPVTVYNLVAKKTIDEYVHKVLHAKQRTSVDILSDDDRLQEMGLSLDDIKAILRL